VLMRRAKNKEAKLDLLGNHGLVCHPGVKAMRATLLEKTLERCFRHPTRQPSTYTLLGGHFSKDDLSRLFPGRLNQAQAEERKKLAMTFLDVMSKTPRGYLRTAELGILRESFPPPTVAGEDDNNGRIRFDMRFALTTPIGNPREVWFDHAIVQETSPTYAESTLSYLEEKKTNLPENSPAFQKMRNSKVGRYAALIAVVNRLKSERKLNFQPTFLFPVVSSLGILNEDMKQLMKLILQRFKDNQQGMPPTSEGLPPSILRGRFKVELKNSICFALVRGNALSMNNQGVGGGVVTPP
jgi:hypothetical protein